MTEEQERAPVAWRKRHYNAAGDFLSHSYTDSLDNVPEWDRCNLEPLFALAKPQPVGSALTEAYWQGWCEAADWAQRDDLYDDRDSDAYANAMKRRLAAPAQPAPEPAATDLQTAVLAIADKHVAMQREHEASSGRVYLVATGETHEGQETYTRHENFPPPMCDSECLYTADVIKIALEALKCAECHHLDSVNDWLPKVRAAIESIDRRAE